MRRALFEKLEERVLLAADDVISVGRVLSAYSTADIQNDELAITYTVYNRQASEAFGVRLTTTLQAGIVVQSTSPSGQQQGAELSWDLGTIPPFGRVSVEVVVTFAGAVPFQLDGGAEAVATVDTATFRDTAPPARLQAAPIDPLLLAGTVDASVADPLVQEQAAVLDYDPQQIFDFLHEEIAYHAYDGSLRGARGTLWSQAGNSLDEASLGVALYRASGIPARYARGTLSQADAQALLLTMFPAPTRVVGYLPLGAEVADPASDPTLLAETRDHFWVQIDTGAGWQDVDPVGLPGIGLGTALTTASETFAEVPDALRHKVHLALEAETFQEVVAAFGGHGLSRATVLDRTWSSAELVGRPVSIGQFVDDQQSGGLAFLSRTLTYTPYVLVGDVADPLGTTDELVTGTPFQETLTNFPLASTILTGLTLHMDLISPGGSVEHHERALVDRIGYAARRSGTTTNVAVSATASAVLSAEDTFTLSVLPGRFDPREPVVLQGLVQDLAQELSTLTTVGQGQLPVDYSNRVRALARYATRWLSTIHHQGADALTEPLARASLVKAYDDKPRLVLLNAQVREGNGTTPGTIQFSLDLRRNAPRTVAFPGQATVATFAFNFLRGLVATEHERQVIASIAPPEQHDFIVNTHTVLEAAHDQQIPILELYPADAADLSRRLTASPDASARIAEALQAGRMVIVPERPVTLGSVQTTAWYEWDPNTGTAISVGENGDHPSALEYLIQTTSWGFFSGVSLSGFNFVGGGKLKPSVEELLEIQGSLSTIWEGLTILLSSPTPEDIVLFLLPQSIGNVLGPLGILLGGGFVPGLVLGFALGNWILGVDPSAEGMFLGLPAERPDSRVAQQAVTVPASTGIALQVVPDTVSATADQNTPAVIAYALQSDLAGDYTVTATAPVGWRVQLTSTTLSITPPAGLQGGTGTVRLVARSLADPSRVAQAQITVTVTPTAPGLEMQLVFDPALTVPYEGALLPTAYQAHLRNRGPDEDRYTITLQDVTPGWEVLFSTNPLTVPAGVTGVTGVYFRPLSGLVPPPGTPLSGLVPPPGTSVTATLVVTTDLNPSRTSTQTIAFTMPEVSSLIVDDSTLFLSGIPGSTLQAYTILRNAGNVPVIATLSAGALPTGVTLVGLPETATLAPGETIYIPYSVGLDPSLPLNTTDALRLVVSKTASGQTVQRELPVLLRVFVPGAAAMADAALHAAELGKSDLANGLDALSVALTNFAQHPTDPSAKSQSVAALDAVIGIIEADPLLASAFADHLRASRDQLAAATTTSDVQETLTSLAFTLTDLSQRLADLVHHRFTFLISPNVVTALPGATARFPILLENHGDQSTTFDLSIVGNLPAGVSAAFDQNPITLLPGQRLDGSPTSPALRLNFSGNELFAGQFRVRATPQEALGLAQDVVGTIAVRPQFVQVASVTPTPAFTPPGGTVSLQARILNAVNRQQQAFVAYAVRDPSGTLVFTSTPQSVTLTVQTSLVDVPLPPFETAGLPPGPYTVLVQVTDAEGAAIPGGTGQTTVLVDTPVAAAVSVTPELVPAGNVTVTNTLHVSARTPLPSPLTLVGQVPTTPTSTSILLRDNLAYVAGTSGIDIVDISNPSAPSVVGTFGQDKIVSGNFTVIRALGSDKIVVATTGLINAPGFLLLTYSVANPTAPVLLGEDTVDETFLTDLFILGTRALVTTFGFTIFGGQLLEQFGDVIALDLTDPNAIVKTDELFGDAADVFNQHGGMLIDASTLYVASTTSTGTATLAGQGIVRVIDVSDPAQLVERTVLTIPGTARVLQIAAEGNRALVVGSTQGIKFVPPLDVQQTGRMTLTLLDLTDPLRPTIVGSTFLTESEFPTDGGPKFPTDGGSKLSVRALGNGQFAVSQGFLNGLARLLLVDTRNDQIAVAAIDVPSGVNEMALADNRLFTTSPSGLTVYELGTMTSLFVTVSVQVPNVTGPQTGNRVRAGSFNIPPDQILVGTGVDTLVWVRSLAFGVDSSTLTWQTDLSGMKPGESRDVTLGSDLAFQFGGTPGSFALPATSVVGQNAVALSPAAQTTTPGAPASYTVVLTNPTDSLRWFTVSVLGVPSSWVSVPRSVFVQPRETTSVTLRLTSETAANDGSYNFVVLAAADAAVQGVAEGTLTLVSSPPVLPSPQPFGVVVAVDPPGARAGQGTAATYVVRLTNTVSRSETFTLAAGGLPPGFEVVLEQDEIEVPPGTDNFRDVRFTIRPPVGTAPGLYPFTITATSRANRFLFGQATGTLQVLALGVDVQMLTPDGPPGSTFLMQVRNVGQVTETFDLAVAAPAALAAVLNTSAVTLPPGGEALVPIPIGEIDDALPGSLPLVGLARARTDPLVADQDTSQVTIAGRLGVRAELDESFRVLPAPGSTTFTLSIRNTGNLEDQYRVRVLSTSGPVSVELLGPEGLPLQTASPFRLPGLSPGVILVRADLLAPGVGGFTVQVQSVTDDTVLAEATANIGQQVNAPPVITSFGGSGSVNVVLFENQNLVADVDATDSDPLTYSLAGGVDASRFAVDPASGVLSFLVAPNFESPTDANGDNLYEVVVQVSDGSLTDTQSFTVAVMNVNEAPVITSHGGGQSAAVSVAENTTAVTTVSAIDPDANAAFSFSIVGGADAARFTISATSGVLSFKVAPDFEQPTDANANNVYEVTVQVSDGRGGVASQQLAVTVTDVAEPSGLLVLGADAGSTSKPRVKVYDAGGRLVSSFLAYPASFRGGVRVALGDVNGDGVPEMVTAPGRGMVAQVKVFTLAGQELTAYRLQVYPSSYKDGVHLAVGDVLGDGRNDLVVVPDRGNVKVRVFENRSAAGQPFSGTPSREFLAFTKSFNGGGAVAVADFTEDGKGDLYVGSGSGMRATVQVFDVQRPAKQYAPVRQYLPLNGHFRGGISLAVGRIDTDDVPDLVITTGAGGGSVLEMRSGASGALLGPPKNPFSAWGQKSILRSAAKDLMGDGLVDALFVVQGPDNRSRLVRKYQPLDAAAVDFLLENDPDLKAGMFIG